MISFPSTQDIARAETRKACEGGVTRSCRMGAEHAQQCRECGTKVRDDMVDHPFFGFANACDKRTE